MRQEAYEHVAIEHGQVTHALDGHEFLGEREVVVGLEGGRGHAHDLSHLHAVLLVSRVLCAPLER